MARKTAQEAAKKKAAKQKKVLIGLALLLVVALVYGYMSLSHGSSPASSPASATTSATTTPAGSPGSIPSGTPAPTVTPGIAAPTVVALRTFTALGRKDPFHDDGPSASDGSSTTTTPASTTSTPATSSTIHDSLPTSKKSSGRPTRAVISVNGKKLTLAPGAKFGHAFGSSVPLFRLLKVSATRAVIAVVGTQLQYTLNVGLPVKLTHTGAPKFTLILERVRPTAPKTASRH